MGLCLYSYPTSWVLSFVFIYVVRLLKDSLKFLLLRDAV